MANQSISILPPEEARKIAAGEVIDRPSALVREFLDNAIDSGGKNIEVIIEDGGIKKTEVADDGEGMGREDLELCWLTHATSKIRSLDDLLSTVTLGFRGEALAAAAAVSRLEIISSRDGKEAWKLNTGPGETNPPVIEQSLRVRGTSVRALGLYDTIPARKRFLKRPGSEGAACRMIFNEKALAFPALAFRFTQDGELKAFLSPASSLKERFGQIFPEAGEAGFLHEIGVPGRGFSISIVAGGPELFRKDRRLQYVFANSRRIQDFALLQAFEYGLEGWFPNGTHPLGAVFVTIDPGLADFNIHPAKREVRFADPGAIHHALSSALRDFCRRRNSAPVIKQDSGASLPFRSTEDAYPEAGYPKAIYPKTGYSAMETLLSNPPDFRPWRSNSHAAEESFSYPSLHPPLQAESINADSINTDNIDTEKGEPRYLGRLFDLFILVAKGESFFIIDQHAAHERILYEKAMQGRIPVQELLVPVPFRTESPDDDSFLEEKKEELSKLGVIIKRAGAEHDEWFIEALPSGWKLPDRETVKEILNLKTQGENFAEHWIKTLSCHTAVKDGEYLDGETALALAKEAFAMQISRCPHGRPIWVEISRGELLKAVRRS